ncbi:MAG: hypothetical protein Q7T71_16170, partial [Herbiconiux sp.]|nr:hypothetical protein [Herbiconiux sp.]
KELEKKEVTPTGEITFTGGSIVDNREEDRVQIFFDQKPDQAMIDKLKGEGWRWAPSVGAWSRKRTDAALYSARRITGAAAPAVQPQAAPPVPVPQPQAVPELRWVYGTREGKWYLVAPGYIDYVHGITQERMKIIGQEAAKAEYLNPSLARAAAPIVGAIDHLKKGDKVSWESPTMRGTFIDGYFVGYNTDGTVDVEHRLAGFAPYKYTVERSK